MVMEPESGREVSPVGVVAMDIVDEGGSVSVGTTVSAEVFGIEPKNICINVCIMSVIPLTRGHFCC